MKELLQVEWLKIKKYTASNLIGIFFLVGIVAANYIVYAFKKNVIDQADPTGMIAGTSPYDFSNVWQTVSYVSGNLLLLPGLLLVMLVTNEFTYRTHRQNIIDGWSRSQFVDVKLAMALLIAVGSTVVVVLTGLVFGLASGTSFSLAHFESVAFFFLKTLSYNLIAVLIAVLVRRTGFAIGVFFVYLWFENFISLLLDVLSTKIKANYHMDLGNMGDYLPMNASDGMLHFPSTTISDMAKKSAILPSNYLYVTLPLALLYLAVFVWWSRNRILKTDL